MLVIQLITNQDGYRCTRWMDIFRQKNKIWMDRS